MSNDPEKVTIPDLLDFPSISMANNHACAWTPRSSRKKPNPVGHERSLQSNNLEFSKANNGAVALSPLAVADQLRSMDSSPATIDAQIALNEPTTLPEEVCPLDPLVPPLLTPPRAPCVPRVPPPLTRNVTAGPPPFLLVPPPMARSVTQKIWF